MRVPGASGGNGVDGREPQAMATSGTIPGRWLVSDGVYRSFGGADGLFGCGFLVKTGCGFDQRKPVSLQHSLVYVLRGTGVYIDADDRRWDLEPGSFFHRFTDRTHSNLLDPGGRWAECFIVLGASMARALIAMGVIDPRRPVLQPGLDLAIVREVRRLREAMRIAAEHELPQLVWALVAVYLRLVMRTGGDVGGRGSGLDEACARLTRDPVLSIAALARPLGISAERFRRVFREHTGESVGRWRTRCRMDLARTLLLRRGASVAGVAGKLGYATPFAFSARFRAATGEPPSAFLRRHR